MSKKEREDSDPYQHGKQGLPSPEPGTKKMLARPHKQESVCCKNQVLTSTLQPYDVVWLDIMKNSSNEKSLLIQDNQIYFFKKAN